MKKGLQYTMVYAVLGLILGVFYREFTKFHHFEGYTSLSLMHTHVLIFGVFFTLLLSVVLVQLGKTWTEIKWDWRFFQGGLLLTVAMMLVRGVLEVRQVSLSVGMDHGISGLAGLGHGLLGIFLVKILYGLYRQAKEPANV